MLISLLLYHTHVFLVYELRDGLIGLIIPKFLIIMVVLKVKCLCFLPFFWKSFNISMLFIRKMNFNISAVVTYI